MRILVKFQKTGAACYISHLDLLRTIQRTVKRMGLKVCYSQGFNPHPVLSFAQALPLGQQSMGEYMEMELEEGVQLEGFLEAFNAQAPEGIRALNIRTMGEKEPNCMAAVCAAEYDIKVDAGIADAIQSALYAFEAAEEVPYQKRGKAGIKTVNMRPQVFKIEMHGNEITALISAGQSHLPVSALMEALHRLSGVQQEIAYDVTRLELYTRDGNDALVPLQNAG